jgi:hypothetical protein
MRVFRLLLALCVLGQVSAFAAEGKYLYRVELAQAAPGKFLELVDLYNKRSALTSADADPAPFIMRHSQGDRWDLMLVYPMNSYADFYSTERSVKRDKSQARSLDDPIRGNIAWQEDLFVYGPALEAVKAAFANSRFFHIEMLRALPGKQTDLVKEREMESAYNKALSRPELFIFVRDQGAAYDVLSIDFYRDIKHYAESADIPPEKQQVAARAAGYSAPEQIGPYLRAIIASHHDTLAVALTPAVTK